MIVPFHRMRDALRRAGFGGVNVPPSSFSTIYARAASSGGITEDGPQEWAVVSYVPTNSPTEGVGGIPNYVAVEVEDVLDSLLDVGVLSQRALWLDTVGNGRTGADAARLMHFIGAPVICVPPTRTKEYARYQKPDRWDPNTHIVLVGLENMLKSCPACGPVCPDEFDSRLINVAAALQTWPMTEAMIGAVGRGAFVSFESFDRYNYTVEWYLVLLHLALESGDYATSLVEKSMELYGQPLFRACSRCITSAKEVVGRGIAPNLKHLEGKLNWLIFGPCSNFDAFRADCISQLVAQASRLTLTRTEERLTRNLWTLPGLQRTPGESILWRYTSNDSRLEVLNRRFGSSTTDLRMIAAGMLRGRPSEGSCTRHSEKWTAATVLANPSQLCSAFMSGMLSKRMYSKVFQDILQNGPFAFGSYLPVGVKYSSLLHPEMRKCKRAPKCTGHNQLCLFSEHSGLVPPSSSVSFLRDCFLTQEEIAHVAIENLKKITAGVRFARVCYLAGWRLVAGKEVCCACQPHRRAVNESRRLVLIGWDPYFRHALASETNRSDSSNSSLSPECISCSRTAWQKNSGDFESAKGLTKIARPNGEAALKRRRIQSSPEKEIPVESREVSSNENAPSKGGIDATSICAEPSLTKIAPQNHVHDSLNQPDEAEDKNEQVSEQPNKHGLDKNEFTSGLRQSFSSPVLSYVVVDAGKMEHVIASGVEALTRGTPSATTCILCNGTITSFELEYSDEMLEIHLDQIVNPDQVTVRLRDGMIAAHNILA